ncbi:MAG TPA: hypothetical protein VMY99_05215 [Nevskiaceae bacterium]|nr:hypothetical protein [Nevskiaceae bacterium]
MTRSQEARFGKNPRVRGAPLFVAVGAVGITAGTGLFAGCSSKESTPAQEKPKPTSASATPSPQALTFKVIGQCSTAGGTLHAEASGFTPSGVHHTEARYPRDSVYKGVQYPPEGLLNNGDGFTDPDGRLSDWQWDCTRDPKGTYPVSVVDVPTGRHVDIGGPQSQ